MYLTNVKYNVIIYYAIGLIGEIRMWNKQNPVYISFLANEDRRISRWKQIKLAYRLVRLYYRLARSGKQQPHEKNKKNLKHLKSIFKNLKIPPMNPCRYWVNTQLRLNTSGTKFNTNWY